MPRTNRKLPGFTTQQIERFWKNVDKRSDDECWPWLGSRLQKSGYGRLKIKGIDYKASRIAYYVYYGEDPVDKFVCHHCDNPPCCNPYHLFAGDAKANARDASAKGRLAFGDRNWTRQHPERLLQGNSHPLRRSPGLAARGTEQGLAKLTDEQVREIRNKYKSGKYSQVVLADEYRVHQGTISSIVLRKTWTHVS